MRKEHGHKLLARLGKTKLRPGGMEATDWLLGHIHFKLNMKFLEVACNMGTNLMELAKKHDCQFYGIDNDNQALAQAKENIADASLDDKVQLISASAYELPFEDNSFDIVMNEAMLTMLNQHQKESALEEYYRVLKPGGLLLTHDVLLKDDNPEIITGLQEVLNIPVQPLLMDDWLALFENKKFTKVKTSSGPMTLLTPKGLQFDEGSERTEKIMENVKNDANAEQFHAMKNYFDKTKDTLHYIAMVGLKEI